MKMHAAVRWLSLPIAFVMTLSCLLMGAGLLYRVWSTDEYMHLSVLRDPAVMAEQRAAWEQNARQIALEQGIDPSLLHLSEPQMVQANRSGLQWLMQLLRDGSAAELPAINLNAIRSKLLADAEMQKAHEDLENWLDEQLMPRLQTAALEAAIPVRFGILQTGLQLAGERLDVTHRVQIPQYLFPIGAWLFAAMLALLLLLCAKEPRWVGFMSGAVLASAAAATAIVYAAAAALPEAMTPMMISARYGAIRRAWSDYLVQLGLPVLAVLLLAGIAVMIAFRRKRKAR